MTLLFVFDSVTLTYNCVNKQQKRNNHNNDLKGVTVPKDVQSPYPSTQASFLRGCAWPSTLERVRNVNVIHSRGIQNWDLKQRNTSTFTMKKNTYVWNSICFIQSLSNWLKGCALAPCAQEKEWRSLPFFSPFLPPVVWSFSRHAPWPSSTVAESVLYGLLDIHFRH